VNSEENADPHLFKFVAQGSRIAIKTWHGDPGRGAGAGNMPVSPRLEWRRPAG